MRGFQIVFAVFFFVHSSSAIRCYQCIFPPNYNCYTSVSEAYSATCDKSMESCTIEEQIEFGRVTINRKCGGKLPGDLDENNCQRLEGNTMKVCYCTEDECNNAPSELVEVDAGDSSSNSPSNSVSWSLFIIMVLRAVSLFA